METITIGTCKYPVELDETLPLNGWYLKGKPMFNLDERVAREISETAKKLQEQAAKDAIFGERPPYSHTARMAASIARQPLFSRPSFTVITSPYVVEKKKRSREKKRGFCRRLWDDLTDLNPWPYSPIEYYETEVPAIIRVNNRIICHPSIEQEIKKAVREGKI